MNLNFVIAKTLAFAAHRNIYANRADLREVYKFYKGCCPSLHLKRIQRFLYNLTYESRNIAKRAENLFHAFISF